MHPDAVIAQGTRIAADSPHPEPQDVAAPAAGWHRVVFLRELNGSAASRWSVDVWADSAAAAIDSVCYSEQTVNGNSVQIVGALRLDTLR